MKKLIYLLLILLISSFNNAQVIQELKEEIKFDNKGSAELKVSIKSDKAAFKELLVPYNCKGKITEIIGNKLFIAKKVEIQGISYIYVTKSDSSSFKECDIAVKIDKFFDFDSAKILNFGNYILKYRFINTRFPKINNYSLKIVLPKNFNITSVDETIPEAVEDNPKIPFKLGKMDEHYFVELTGDNVKLGENLFIKFRFKETGKSLILALLFGVLAVGYLIIFRDLRKPKAN